MRPRLPPLNALKAFEAAARHESFTRAAEAHSGIDLRISATLHHVDFAREEVDLAVRHGDGNWPGLDAVRLSPEQLFAVCSPKLLSGRRRLATPADLLKFPLIHMDSRTDWNNWLREAGLDEGSVTHGPVLNRASMVIDAAINGQGIALARTTLAAWDLITGHLVLPFQLSLPLSKTYWIICPKATASLPKIVTFRDWLLAEAASDLRQLKKLAPQPNDRRPVRADRSDGVRRRRLRPESVGDG